MWLHITTAEYSTFHEAGVQSEMNVNVESQKEEQPTAYGPDGQGNPEAVPDQNAQDGVRIAEAMTLSWSKSSLIIVYMWSVITVNDDVLDLKVLN